MTIIVIGAGFAGLSAAYYLYQAGKSVTVLEARDRIGGRVQTSYDFADIPVELGAELIHGTDVITWEWVHKLNLETMHWIKQSDSLFRLEDGRLLNMLEARQQVPGFDVTRRWNLPDIPAGEGETWDAYLRRIGFTEDQIHYTQRAFANSVGESMSRLSAKAMLLELDLDIHNPNSGGYAAHDYRILRGYAQIYNALAENLDIRLNTVVTEVQWGDDGVTVMTENGEAFQAEKCLVTLSVGVLKAGMVRFVPELPPIKQQALSGLEMGPVMKMIYRFAEPLTPPEIAAIYSCETPPMWWTPTFGREGHDTVWTAFFSGDYARELLAMGEAAALQKGLATLRRELDKPDLTFIDAQWINWPEDPFSMGGYSHVIPGHEDAREQLAQPTPPLYWAGEASAPHVMTASVHGAYESGKRAAEEILMASGE